MQKASPLLSSVVVCKNNHGEEITANILRLRRYSAAFEIYNPYSIIQISEVLRDFRIRVGDRIVYEGEAVVSGLVNTGLLVVCEVTLGDFWINMEFLQERGGSLPLRDQFSNFLSDWKKANEVDLDFKVATADVHNMLVGLQRWLEHVDLGVRASSSSNQNDLEREVLEQVKGRIKGEVHDLFDSFEQTVRKVPEGREATHKNYLRRLVHQLFLCAPYPYRTFHKPLGYAGDYEMVNMMLRDPFEGGSLFAKGLNYAFLETPPVIAHRNRISYLSSMLREEANRCTKAGRKTNILNLGCGPAHEMQRFLANEEISDMCALTLLDFNEETVDFTRGKLTDIRAQSGRVTPITLLERSVQHMLKQHSRADEELNWESFDVVYCAGLFDYLSQRVCKRLTEVFARLLRPGGLLVLTNVSTDNPSKGCMEYLLEWNLVYRDRTQMLDLIPSTTAALDSQLKADATGVNYFLEIRKRGEDATRRD